MLAAWGGASVGAIGAAGRPGPEGTPIRPQVANPVANLPHNPHNRIVAAREETADFHYNAGEMNSRFAILAVAACAVLCAQDSGSATAKPIRLAIAGLNHGHVAGFLKGAQRRKEVEIVGVWDPDSELLAKYGKADNFAAGILFTDLAKMLDTVKPEAVATFTDTFGHAGRGGSVRAAPHHSDDGEAAGRRYETGARHSAGGG